MRGSHVADGELVDLSLGLLEPESRARLLEHLRSCTACAAEMRQQLGDGEILRSRFLARPGRRPRRRRSVAVAGAVAVAALLVVMLRPTPEQPSEWLALPPEVTLRSPIAGEGEAALAAALERYAAQDAQGVIDLLTGLEVVREQRPLRDCYLGSALYHVGRFEEAVALLTPLVERGDLPQPWRGQIENTLDRARAQLVSE